MEKATPTSQPTMRRSLRNRHLQMIALGGAIGTGLFYGSASSISLTGPSILVAYVLGGAIIFLVMRALGEMSAAEPVSGAFSHYAYEYWSPFAGFVSGWNYWFNYILVAMAELSVVGIYINYWLPHIPHWASAAICLVLITLINVVSVRAYGEFEFWFAIIKVAAVIGMIILGIIVIACGINNNPDLPAPSFSHLTSGSFFAGGLGGFLMALVPVMFSFGGVELIGITAGEAENPQQTIPKAINQIVWRILLFYVAALAIIMCVIPWSSIDGELSPFVQIFDNVGVRFAAHILNFVVLTAALSVYNSGLYSNGRMLYALSQQGNAPRFLQRLSSHGTPVAGILTSSLITVVAVVIVLLWPDFAFTYLMSIALIAGIINWSMIMITQVKFRRAHEKASDADKLVFRLPGGYASTIIVLACLAAIVVIMAFTPGYQTAVVIAPVWLLVLTGGYFVKKSRQSTHKK